MSEHRNQVTMEEVTDPVLIAQARARRERFDRNMDWLEAHATEVYSQHRGRCIAIAGQQLFVADTPEEVLTLARAAHAEDDGMFTGYIPREKVPRIYAH